LAQEPGAATGEGWSPRATPYWWDAAPPEDSRVDLPARVDVAIVGSGFAGLSAALEAPSAAAPRRARAAW
jgi:NADPH-dependent 2,4-dienoyl-CoA reductase/sulfur reductase-like enzyme